MRRRIGCSGGGGWWSGVGLDWEGGMGLEVMGVMGGDVKSGLRRLCVVCATTKTCCKCNNFIQIHAPG